MRASSSGFLNRILINFAWIDKTKIACRGVTVLQVMKHMKNKIYLPLIFAFTLIVLSACSSKNAENVRVLENSSWQLTRYAGMAPIQDRAPTLNFAEGQVSGTTGCNHYGGGFELRGDRLRLDAVFQTEMACPGPEGLMEQEAAYLALLTTVERFELADGLLTLFTGEGQTLQFVAGPPIR